VLWHHAYIIARQGMLIAQQLCSIVFPAYIGKVLGTMADSQTAMLR